MSGLWKNKMQQIIYSYVKLKVKYSQESAVIGKGNGNHISVMGSITDWINSSC